MASRHRLSRWNGHHPVRRHITYLATLLKLCGAPHNFRVGDFFELFDADAQTAAKELGLTLTTRDRTTAMAGFPHHALETYLRKLLTAGHRVAICEQDEPSLSTGRIQRDVTRVVTQDTAI